MPALPFAEAVNGYVAAAYLVFFALVLSYVAIMGVRLARIERELAELDELAAEQADEPEQADDHEREPIAS